MLVASGSQFDPQVVAAFLQVLDKQEEQTGTVQVEEPQREETTPKGGALPLTPESHGVRWM